MSAPFPHGFTITVKRPGGRSEMGDKLPGSTHDVEGCAWGPRMRESSEVNDVQRSSAIQGLQLYGPPMMDVLADDEIVLPPVMNMAAWPEKKRTFRVVGEVGEWRNPFTGWYPGAEVALERVS